VRQVENHHASPAHIWAQTSSALGSADNRRSSGRQQPAGFDLHLLGLSRV